VTQLTTPRRRSATLALVALAAAVAAGALVAQGLTAGEVTPSSQQTAADPSPEETGTGPGEEAAEASERDGAAARSGSSSSTTTSSTATESRTRTVVTQTVDGERTTIVIEDGEVVEHRTEPVDEAEAEEMADGLAEDLQRRLDAARDRLPGAERG
jgi:cytoskeletal protein RodZ